MHMTRCLPSLVIKDMEISPTGKYHFKITGMLITKRQRSSKDEIQRNLNPLLANIYFIYIIYSHFKKTVTVPQNIRHSYDQAIQGI